MGVFIVIIIRYLVCEMLKSQLVILFILLLIFFCQKLVRIFGVVVDGDILINLVFLLLGFGILEMVQFILLLSLFFGLLMIFGKLYIESEIMVMYVCGLSKVVLIKVVMIFVLFIGVVVVVNVMWVGLWLLCYQDEVLVEVKVNFGMVVLVQGQFQQVSDGNVVMFIESVNGNCFYDVFFVQLCLKGNVCFLVVVVDFGELLQQKDGLQVVIFNKGICFEGIVMLCDFCIIDFNNYQVIIGYQVVSVDLDDIEQMDMCILWKIYIDCVCVELYWCFMLVVIVFIMVLMVVLFSVVNLCQGCVLLMLLVMLFYLVFFLL